MLSALLAWTVVSEPPRPRCVQKQKRVAKPLMVELSIMMIDELGDGPARGS